MISRVRRFIVDRMLWRGRMGSGGTEHDDDQDGIRQQEALMTRRIHLQLAAIVSNDGTRCAAECPHRDGGYGHCTAFDRPLVMDLGHGAYDRCPTCIAAEQAAALVPSCEGARGLDASEALREARVQGMREARQIVRVNMHIDTACADILRAIEAVRKGER